MKILVLNCGSPTLKFQLIETASTPRSTADDVKLARGIVDRIGGTSSLRFEAVGSTEKQVLSRVEARIKRFHIVWRECGPPDLAE